MMAHDPNPGPTSLPAETMEAVRVALVKYIDAPLHANGLHEALHHMATEARERSILPEQLLVTLKDIWHQLPGVQDANQTTDQVLLLQRVVTMCIKEYYAG